MLDPQENVEVKKRTEAQGKNMATILTNAQKANYVPLPVGTTLVIGATKSGKSNLVVHMLTSDQIFKNQFSELHILGLTCDKVDPSFAYVKEQAEASGCKVKLQSDESEFDTTIHEIIERQKGRLRRTEHEATSSKPYIVCIWMDDISNCTRFIRESKELKTLATMSRHVNICCIINVHKFKLCAPIIRNNAWSVIFMTGANMTELHQFAEDFCPPDMHVKDFIKIVQYCLNEPYSFCYVNRQANIHERTRKRFSEIITTGGKPPMTPAPPSSGPLKKF